MAILTHPVAWRRERGPNARQPDLDDVQLVNARAAIRFLRVQRGSARRLAAALRLPYATVTRAVRPTGTMSLRMVLRVARAAGVPIDDVLSGEWPGDRCPMCGRS
jgi:hypothetical protein